MNVNLCFIIKEKHLGEGELHEKKRTELGRD